MALMTKNIDNITITNNINLEFNLILDQNKNRKTFIITDDNVFNSWAKELSYVFDKFPVFIIKNGDANKNIRNLENIWDFLIENKADRNSLIINIGGGVITDIGGFAASTFKRGVNFINIPTSLLAQVDASIGGKTGINYKDLKNEIGVINQAEKVVVYPSFLKTLPKNHILSGFAEMIKHGFIYDKKHLDELFIYLEQGQSDKNYEKLTKLIVDSIKIKNTFIKNDIKDQGLRKILNFGHTFGHAIESYYNKTELLNITHGEAVIQGVIFELFISHKKKGLKLKEFLFYVQKIIELYGKLTIDDKAIKEINELINHDKKNINEKILIILLENIGKATINNEITKNDIADAFNFYLQISK